MKLVRKKRKLFAERRPEPKPPEEPKKIKARLRTKEEIAAAKARRERMKARDKSWVDAATEELRRMIEDSPGLTNWTRHFAVPAELINDDIRKHVIGEFPSDIEA